MAAPLSAFNLKRWIDDHRNQLRPPVGAEMIWKDSQFIVMIIGGPNARRDFHIDPGDEFFYQLEGDMVLEYIDGEGKRHCESIREGDVFLVPANTPHSPQRPANSVGLVVERVREANEPAKVEGCARGHLNSDVRCLSEYLCRLISLELNPMANDEHLKILKQGVEVWNHWRSENPTIRPDLHRAKLIRADLRSANFSG